MLSTVLVFLLGACQTTENEPEKFVNSIGMEMVRIAPGSFIMGNEGEILYDTLLKDAVHASYIGKGGAHPYLENGSPMAANPLEWDESPAHRVRISRRFYMASTQVTNRQYEQFDPSHAALRGKRAFSSDDDEAVLFVSWDDAVAFTRWLTDKEGKPYRLPTEAEWEYAARAGSTTAYHTGQNLPNEYHRHQVMNRTHSLAPDQVNLLVGMTKPNDWGLHDMHGLVEEWCFDWYGPYTKASKKDPVGYEEGVARVTRGGSHSTGLVNLRSASRSGALPETRNFLTGFRVVMGEMPSSKPISNQKQPLWARNVVQETTDENTEAGQTEPLFLEPKTYTRIDASANGPLFITHNHNAALTSLPNGDLLAIWFSTVKERGREMTVAGSRLRKGATEWDSADVFFHIPGRNQSGQALFWDGINTVYHMSGVGAGDHWRDLAMVMRKSTDNGVTWSRPEMIGPEFGLRHQVIDAMIKTSSGELVLLCDAHYSGDGGTAVHISSDGGNTWNDPGKDQGLPVFEDGRTGAWIAGIHASIVELSDGRWLAFGRGNEIGQCMPMSISADKGRSWTYVASPFRPVVSAQRTAMVKLREQALVLFAFDTALAQKDILGNEFTGSGMYAAVSFDDGKTWPVKKLITPGSPKRVLTAPCNLRWGEQFSILDWNRAESRGYLSATQSSDGMIHVLSSGTHYAFNLAWLLQAHPSIVKKNTHDQD